MYDADYASYLEDLREEAKLLELKTPAMDAGHPPDFVVRDSGSKAQYDDGMQRDDPTGKPKFRLMWPKGVPYEEQLMYRVAMHYMHGGITYGDRNWEKSSTEKSLAAHEEALERHFHKFLEGVEDGEDHAAAVVWNINAVLLTRRNIKLKKQESVFPENLMPGEEVFKSYIFPYVGGDSASTGRYCAKEIRAENYEAAKREFDLWERKQPFYNMPGKLW